MKDVHGKFTIELTDDMSLSIREDKADKDTKFLVYYEKKSSYQNAKDRKKSLELWSYEKIKKLVESLNPELQDISYIWQFNLSSIN